MWYTYALLSALFASLVAIVGKLGLKGLDSTIATTIRSVIMAIFLIGVSFSFGKFNNFNFHLLSFKDWGFIVLSGVFGALSWLFYFYALKIGTANQVVAIDKLSIVFTVILAFVFLGEALSFKIAGGVTLMTIGAILISLK
jgi:transporter family protein